MALLELKGLNKHFGGLHVTNAVDLALEEGEIHCLIGPNGAGKSTLFRLILGEHRPGSGDIYFAGENITALEIDRLVTFTGLEAEQAQQAGNLSHGQKQWLEIGMAISLKPRLLLLDEPTAGMSPEETHLTGEMVQRLNADGMTVLAIEHDMAFVRQVARRVTVLHLGQVFAQGSMEQIIADERVAAIYLGQAHA